MSRTCAATILALVVASSGVAARDAARPQVTITAPQARALLLLRVALPPSSPERRDGVDDLRDLARRYVAARPDIALAGMPDVGAGELEPTLGELRRAARRIGAAEIAIVTVEDYRGCRTFSLPVPVISNYGRGSIRLERYDAATGTRLQAVAAVRHAGGPFVQLDHAARTSLFLTTLDALRSGAVEDDSAARDGFARACRGTER